MKLKGQYHLTYCTNIHAGESWQEVFQSLQDYVPAVKQKVQPNEPFGLGLRLSNQATLDLNEAALEEFKHWLVQHQLYVFTLNGFPYGGFHQQRVKDNVHQPDWTTNDRLDYTNRSFDILAQLLPQDMEGGISSSPLSYLPWYAPEERPPVYQQCTINLLQVVKHLIAWKERGVYMHLDLEPEPDGFLEDTATTVDYYQQWLLPIGTKILQQDLGLTHDQAHQAILDHIQICYDVCHFAVAYETPTQVLTAFENLGIKVGKIQISAALKKQFGEDSIAAISAAFSKLNEPTYLHQVVAQQKDGSLLKYPDLPEALAELGQKTFAEWRTHFHVPIFKDNFGLLESTQEDIVKVIQHWSQAPWSTHLEVETYTWEVLPADWQLGLIDSICRELQWVLTELDGDE